MARRKVKRSGCGGLSACLLATPLTGEYGMEAWAGSSLNKRGVRRTRLPSGVGLLLAITLKKGRTKRPGQKVVYMSDLSTDVFNCGFTFTHTKLIGPRTLIHHNYELVCIK